MTKILDSDFIDLEARTVEAINRLECFERPLTLLERAKLQVLRQNLIAIRSRLTLPPEVPQENGGLTTHSKANPKRKGITFLLH